MSPLAKRWSDLLISPIKALYSKAFYLQILFARRGLGFTYLLFVSLLLAVPVTYKLTDVVEILKSYELSKLVAQVPPSYISPEGLLTSKSDINYAEIQNSSGQTVIVFNPDDLMLDASLADVPIEITSRSLVFRLHNEDGSFHSVQEIPWTMIFERGGNFEPMQAAAAFEEACSAPAYAFYVGAVIYLLLSVLLNWVLIAAFGRLSMYFLSGVRIRFRDALRLSAYANTLVMLIGVLNFFMTVSIDYTILFLLPIIYIIMVGRYIRGKVTLYGDKVFARAIELRLKRDGLEHLPTEADYLESKAQIEGGSAKEPNSQDQQPGIFMP